MEDDFDGQNRMNLRHFIGMNESKKPLSDDDISSEVEYPLSYYYIQNPSMYGPISDKSVERRVEIERIPTFAIFHKLATGKGVPHTFVGEFAFFTTLQFFFTSLGVGFIRQWPALPRVVVCITMNAHFTSKDLPCRYSCRSALFLFQEYQLKSDML